MEKMNGKLVTFTGIIVLVLLVAIFGFLFWEPKPEYIQGEAEATEVRISGKVPGRIAQKFTLQATYLPKVCLPRTGRSDSAPRAKLA